MVERCGNGDAHRLRSLEKFRVMEEGLGMGPFRDFFGSRWDDICHTDQLHPFHFGIFFCVELAQVPDADHTDSDLLHLPTDSPL